MPQSCWGQAVAWGGPESVHRGKDGGEQAPRWCVDWDLDQVLLGCVF